MIDERANDSIFFKDKPLKSCPFCGADMRGEQNG